MGKREIREGLHGGVDLLDRSERAVVDRDEEERTEPLNLRSADLLDQALSRVLGENVGGYLTNKLFNITVPESTRVDDLEFDRFYFERSLLVDLHAHPYNDYDKVQLDAEITRKTKFAKDNGYRYLPIVGVEVDPATLRKVLFE